jgi:integrase
VCPSQIRVLLCRSRFGWLRRHLSGHQLRDRLPLMPRREMRVALHHTERLPPAELLDRKEVAPSIARREAKVWRLCRARHKSHTFAMPALASGEDPGWVAKMLGHTTLQMIFTTYYRYLPNLTRRDGTLLAKRLGRSR